MSPKDYHHFHAPCDMEVISCQQVGYKSFFSVKVEKVLSDPKTLLLNKRMVMKARTKWGNCYLVFIGALNVDDIVIDCGTGTQLKKGDRIGHFEMGSSIVMLA